ncbi:capsid protein [Streptomyces sp. ISL-43]|uniref:phage minor capsid protein n=1 Tax=Streptomyces sp. ISL-43 TaxID=2819183 RepID=UPI001BEB51FB|nr:phage minor capsid protein [Streptomyces sp. ISL-43]MBT2449472.1 capsid protein [Streptomyces sp. ISL-43]
MPVSPAMAEDLAAAITVLYEDAEIALIEILRKALAEGIDSPRWAELKLRSVGDLREAVEAVTQALQTDANGAVAQALATAYGRGRQAAVAELGALDIGRELQARRILPGAPAVDRLAASYAQDTRPLYQRITRAVLDVFRNVTSRAASTQLLTGQTRRDASQRALNDFARRGVTGFIDSRGHAWELAAYAEMAVRSITARAAIEGHIDALAEIGAALVMVSDAPLECERCRPWEGEILALQGAPGARTVRLDNAVQPSGLFARTETVAVHVAGSLAEARAAGLFHPNCRHSLGAYLPGVTTRPPHDATPGTTYQDSQRQRAIERHIRQWKRRQAAAIDERTRKAAAAKVREWQAAARANVAAHDAIVRKPAREQIGQAR